ncbi:MAG: 4Fe-4S binding protein [archaeon]|nr:MAG: 4Fe-4S binding protein [archaeon]
MVLVEVMLNFFRKRFTRDYPRVQPGLPENFRGPVEWNRDTCIFCGTCAKNCPAFAIKIDKEARQLTVDSYKCISCQVCEENCPTKPKSIKLTPKLHATKARGEKT